MAEGAYARAGVDQLLSGNAVAALVDVLAGIRTGRPSRAALASTSTSAATALPDRSWSTPARAYAPSAMGLIQAN